MVVGFFEQFFWTFWELWVWVQNQILRDFGEPPIKGSYTRPLPIGSFFKPHHIGQDVETHSEC